MKFETPEYSQFLDIKDEDWQGRSCGILCLKTLIDYWFGNKKMDSKDMDALIQEALDIDGYIPEIGWKHKELAEVAKKHKLDGENFDWTDEHPDVAFNRIIPHLTTHPVIASIYKDLDKEKNGHLVVITGYEDGNVYYNDPDSKKKAGIKRSAPLQAFLDGWTRRIVVIHPTDCNCNS